MENNSFAIEESKSHNKSFFGMSWIPTGTFTMGSDIHYPEEGPSHKVSVDGFWIDKFPVTNEDFEIFVNATQYITVAERSPDPDDYPGVSSESLVP